MSTIIAGDDFKTKLGLPCVSDLVHAIRTGREVIPITVRVDDSHVVTGADVLAAYVIMNRSSIPVVPVEVSNDEFVAMRAADEARISAVRSAESAAVSELLDVVEKTAQPVPKHGKVPEKSARSVARDLVAQLIGSTSTAMRRADERRKRKPKLLPLRRDESWSLECYGNQASRELIEDAKLIHDLFVNIDATLRNAQGQVSKLVATRLGETRGARLKSNLHSSAVLVRSLFPYALCPYCKDVAIVRQTCGACWSSGFVGRDAFVSAPDELRDYPCVSHGGQYVDPITLKPYTFPVRGNQTHAPVFDESEPDYVDEPGPAREVVRVYEASDEPETVDDPW